MLGWMRAKGVNPSKKRVTGSRKGLLTPKNLITVAKSGMHLGIKGNLFQICCAGKREDSSRWEFLILQQSYYAA